MAIVRPDLLSPSHFKYRSWWVIFLGALFIAFSCSKSEVGEGEYVYDSAYNHYIIRRKGAVVEMLHVRETRGWRESAVDLDNPLRQVIPYTSTLFAGIFFKNNPSKVLMIGLGGGGFNRLFNAAFPGAILQSVELDPVALQLANKHMGFRETDKNLVSILDGRLFIRKTKKKWDWIILDAFRGGEVPFHLKTKEFYAETKKSLSYGGIVISNLHFGNLLYYSDVKTLQSSFSQVIFFKVRNRGNVIAIAANYDSPKLLDQVARYKISLANSVLRNYLDLQAIKEDTITLPEHTLEKTAQVLTDDFAPVEYLRSVEK